MSCCSGIGDCDCYDRGYREGFIDGRRELVTAKEPVAGATLKELGGPDGAYRAWKQLHDEDQRQRSLRRGLMRFGRAA